MTDKIEEAFRTLAEAVPVGTSAAAAFKTIQDEVKRLQEENEDLWKRTPLGTYAYLRDVNESLQSQLTETRDLMAKQGLREAMMNEITSVYQPPGYDRRDGWEYRFGIGQIVRVYEDDKGRRCTSFIATLNNTPPADFESQYAIGVAIVDALQANGEPQDRYPAHKSKAQQEDEER